tara:strand:- start:71 stop:445 length:375 start_codon:yes stop_codon:yes gene_type:complete
MTKFIKECFTYEGGYLMYRGPYPASKTYDEVHGIDNIHPSRIGMQREVFIARFKYKGVVTKATFLKELIKNHTVETYLGTLDETGSPLCILSEANPTWYAKLLSIYKAKNAKRPYGKRLSSYNK